MSALGILALGIALTKPEVVIVAAPCVPAEAAEAMGLSCSKVFRRGEEVGPATTCSLRELRTEDSAWFEVRSETRDGVTVVEIKGFRGHEVHPERSREMRFSTASLGKLEGESIGLVIAALYEEPERNPVPPSPTVENRAPPHSEAPRKTAPRVGATRWGTLEVVGGASSLTAPSALSYFGGARLSLATGTPFEPGIQLRFGGGSEPTDHVRLGGALLLDYWIRRGWLSAAVRLRGQIDRTELSVEEGGASDSGEITQGGVAAVAVGDVSLGHGWGLVLAGGPTWLWPPTSVQVGSETRSVGQALGWDASIGIRVNLP